MGYDKNMRFVSRMDYSTTEWNSIMKNELDSQRPIIYSGVNNQGGHAFVLDGWLRLGYGILRTPVGGGQSEQVRTKFDLVHCNFGYSGDADGYYLPGAFDLSETEFDKFADMYDDAGYSISYNFHTNFKEITFNL